ncbi:NAD(P)-dependent oxidoreductase [Pseudomonas sp. PH1b]|uniref:NAD-dependent epimerase/dehydratase family protein n=1 Tax=Pseudomonas sp. PH1b TaxID=1397282 RepID=UPI00046A390A|nr:NAD(P)-dependent oxidoreductase [Pseudomonas sp. PH1b]
MKVSLVSRVVVEDLQRVLGHLRGHDELQGKHLLITGSTGFFGKWLLALLALLNRDGAGITVTAVSRAPERFLKDYPEYRQAAWLHWVRGDVQEPIDWPVGRPLDLILHAATDTLAAAHSSPLRIYDTILGGARNVLELAVATGARRVLFTGSGAQYGTLPFGRPVLESSPLACNSSLASSAYGEAKRAQETLAALYAREHGLEVLLTRCFAFSGPGIALDAHFAIGNFVRDALWREQLVLQSSGQAVRSYLHGSDLAVWLLSVLLRGEAGQVYNLGSDQAISIADLARRVVSRIAPEKAVLVLGQDGEPGSQSYYVPDISKARALGLDDWTDLDHSIDSMARWVRESRSSD